MQRAGQQRRGQRAARHEEVGCRGAPRRPPPDEDEGRRVDEQEGSRRSTGSQESGVRAGDRKSGAGVRAGRTDSGRRPRLRADGSDGSASACRTALRMACAVTSAASAPRARRRPGACVPAGGQGEDRVAVRGRVRRRDGAREPVVRHARDQRRLRLGQRGIGRHDAERGVLGRRERWREALAHEQARIGEAPAVRGANARDDPTRLRDR